MSSVPVMLVTANVGSIFEDPTKMLKLWTEEFLSKIVSLDIKFIALHCQEVGGKKYEKSMKHVKQFVQLLTDSKELKPFNKSMIFLDEDYTSVEHFTALGNLYFIHNSIENALIWDFKKMEFTPVLDDNIFSGDIEIVDTKEKAKFPQNFFPECKWSRKGFMRTRWSLCGTVFDLVNIHLFHDASNLVAMSSTPSVYCRNRQRALEHTLYRFHNDPYDNVPCFVFGDFNFRTDNDGVIKKLSSGLTKTRIQNTKSNDHTKLHFTNEDNNLILAIGKKEFNHSDHGKVFLNYEWLKMFDKETEAFNNILREYPISFAPSYPFEEDISKGNSYMPTRCPAWCDRVLFNPSTQEIVSEDFPAEYTLIGLNTCMGDHKSNRSDIKMPKQLNSRCKELVASLIHYFELESENNGSLLPVTVIREPVCLRIPLKTNAGTIKCCDHALFVCLPETCQCCRTFASVTINVVDMSDHKISYRKSLTDIPIDLTLLHEPVLKGMHSNEPYTPESSDSHSPIAEASEMVDIQEQSRRSSVSPKQLKNKLENIIMLNNTLPLIKDSSVENSYSSDSNTLFSQQIFQETRNNSSENTFLTYPSKSDVKPNTLTYLESNKYGKIRTSKNNFVRKSSFNPDTYQVEFKRKYIKCCEIA